MNGKELRVAILGTENSHALHFAQLINGGHPARGGRPFPGFRVTCAYGYDGAANDALRDKAGVTVFADSPEALVGQADAVMVTARHGANHLPYVREFLKAGIPAFVDKPLACDEGEAVELVKTAKQYGAPVCSFSCCGFVTDTAQLKNAAAKVAPGEVMGGAVAAPVSLKNDYGDFWFYSQHLVQIMCEIFGYNVKTVRAVKREASVTMTAGYENYDVSGHWGPADYSAAVYFAKRTLLKSIDISTDGYLRELQLFTDMVLSGVPPMGYAEMIKPVFILNAVKKAFESGNEIAVGVPEL